MYEIISQNNDFEIGLIQFLPNWYEILIALYQRVFESLAIRMLCHYSKILKYLTLKIFNKSKSHVLYKHFFKYSVIWVPSKLRLYLFSKVNMIIIIKILLILSYYLQSVTWFYQKEFTYILWSCNSCPSLKFTDFICLL